MSDQPAIHRFTSSEAGALVNAYLVETAAGLVSASPAEGGVKRAKWTAVEHERFTRAFENYLHTGTAGSNARSVVLRSERLSPS